MSELEHPKRMTLSQVVERLTEKTPHATRVPTFEISQVKGVGGAVVNEWEVVVPVCDEYPTAELAHAAALKFAGALREAYPPPDQPPAKEPTMPSHVAGALKAARRGKAAA